MANQVKLEPLKSILPRVQLEEVSSLQEDVRSKVLSSSVTQHPVRSLDDNLPASRFLWERWTRDGLGWCEARSLVSLCEWSKAPPMIQDAITNWNGQDRGIVMAGARGVGKTMGMALMMVGLASVKLDFAFCNAHTIFKLFQTFTPEARERHKMLTTCGHLFVDDLGTEYAKDWNHGEFYELVNHRELLRRPTTVTTNLSLDEWEQQGMQWLRIIDRLRGQALDWIEIGGSSMREQ